MYRWWRSITKKCKTYLSPFLKDQKKVIKLGNIKPSEFMLKECPNILLTPIQLSRKSWRKEPETGLSLLHRWMQVQVELTPLSPFSSNKLKSLTRRRDKNCPLFTWSILQVVKKLEKLEPQEIVWNKQQVSTKVYLSSVLSSVPWQTKLWEKIKELLFHTETHALQEFFRMPWEVTPKLSWSVLFHQPLITTKKPYQH